MTFAFRFLPVLGLGILFGAAPALATEPRLDTDTCNQMRLEHLKYVESGAADQMQRGPEWAKSNLGPDKLRDMELFIQLDEQIKFGCRDAKLTLDAERAGEAAKRLEANPDLDPTVSPPVPGADDQSSSDSDGTADPSDDGVPVKSKPKAAKKKTAGEKSAKSDDATDDAKSGGKSAEPIDDSYKAPPIVQEPAPGASR
jgi:hypothetical protein